MPSRYDTRIWSIEDHNATCRQRRTEHLHARVSRATVIGASLFTLGCPPTPVETTSDTQSASTGNAQDTTASPTVTSDTVAGDTESSTSTDAGIDCSIICDSPWSHQGDLEVTPDTPAESLHCLSSITGGLRIKGFAGPLPLELRSLQHTGDFLSIELNPGLVNLQGLECFGGTLRTSITLNDSLSDVSALEGVTSSKAVFVWGNPELSDLSPLSSIEDLEELEIMGASKLASLPSPPASVRLRRVRISECHHLLNLDDLMGVQGTADLESVELSSNSSLESIEGLLDLWSSETIGPGVHLTQLPALKSLLGLQTLTKAKVIELRDLPLISTLQGLQGIKEADFVYLDNLPALTSFVGANNVQKIAMLQLGGCSTDYALDAVKDFAGLSSLQELGGLYLARNDVLASFSGLDSLALGPQTLVSIENPSLPPNTLADFAMAHGIQSMCQEPPNLCSCYVSW